MHVEVIRAVAAWLEDATNGVNAKIDGLTLDGSDAAPSKIADVQNEMDDDIAALRRVPDETSVPLLFVFMPGNADFGAVNQAKQDAETFPVWIAYLDRDPSAAAAIRDASYVLRAARKSLNAFHQNNVAARIRNNIEIRNGNIRMSLVRPTVQMDTPSIVLALQVLYAVRDTAP